MNVYAYTAFGQKLGVKYYWDLNSIVQPLSGTSFTKDDINRLSGYKEVLYEGNLICEDWTPKKLLVDNGYYDFTENKYYFYIKDHLGNNRVVADAQGEVVQRNDYYPFGMPYGGNEDAGVQPFKYNGKEFDTMNGLNQYDYHARQLMSDIPIFTGVDPMAEKYYSISPYVYCANNPLKFVDPNGEDYVVAIERDEKGNITGLNIQTQVYITGDLASVDKAKSLNNLVGNTFKSQTIDGIKVSFSVNYEYKKDISSSELRIGENILTFSSEEGRSTISKNTGTIYSNADDRTIFHETAHFMGLSDRYSDLDSSNLDPNPAPYIHPGYEKDLMARGTSLDKSHYQHYVDAFGRIKFVSTVMGKTNSKVDVRQSKYGNKLLSPYEDDGVHKPHFLRTKK